MLREGVATTNTCSHFINVLQPEPQQRHFHCHPHYQLFGFAYTRPKQALHTGATPRAAIAEVSSKPMTKFPAHSRKTVSLHAGATHCFCQEDKYVTLYQSGWRMVNCMGSQINILGSTVSERNLMFTTPFPFPVHTFQLH